MYLTAVFKIHANNHDRCLMAAALSRWSRSMRIAMARAERDHRTVRPNPLLGCISRWTSKDGTRTRLVVDRARLHALVLGYCRIGDMHLHSSSKMSLIVVVEELLSSYLGLYVDWLKNERRMPRPSFPTIPPGSAVLAERRWVLAVEQSIGCASYEEEQEWRREVLRASKHRLLPFYFGAATSGVESQAHMGLLQRADGRLFALLTLWPQGDRRGEAVRRARNRRDRGAVRSTRAGVDGTEFVPSPRSQASIMVPLEFSRGDDPTSAHGRKFLFLRRATAKSAELVHTIEGDWYLHVAFEFPEHPQRPLSGSVLAIKRGVATLMAYAVLDGRGHLLEQGRLEGGDLVRLVTAIREQRARRQELGYTLKGDRRLARLTEAHLYSAGHQIIDLACRHGAEIVLFKDRYGRKPQPYLAYRHFHRLAEILGQLCHEAGLPPPRERTIYGSWATCLRCGWSPGKPVRLPEAGAECCGACGTAREPEFHHAALLAWDALRLRLPAEPNSQRIPLGEFISSQRQTGV